MRRLGWACALVLLFGCDEEDDGGPVPVDRSLLDAGSRVPDLDASQRPADMNAHDSAALPPACPALDVCTEGEPALLHNVCVQGAPSGPASQPVCLVDPNGRLYLAPLADGQRVINAGWRQSADGTLDAADQARCDEARAALLADAASPSCAVAR